MKQCKGLTKDEKWIEGDKVEFDGLCYILPQGRAAIIDSNSIIDPHSKYNYMGPGISIWGFIEVIPKTVIELKGEPK